MRNRLLLAALLLLLLAPLERAAAQGTDVVYPEEGVGFLLGPVGGINLVAYNSNSFPIINSEPTCFTAKNGADVAPWGGFTLEFPLGQNMQNFIVGEVIYDSKSSKFTATQGDVVTRPTKLGGVQAEGSVLTSLRSNLAYLLINLAYKYNFTEGPSPVGFGIQVGPSVGIKMTSDFNKTVTVTASSGNPANPSASQTITSVTPVNGAQSLRIALRGQATYDIPFSQSWIATPTAGYDFPVTKVDNVRSWSASSAFAGLAFRYFWKGF